MALNERDKTLSQSQQDAIKKATEDYNAAAARGDKAGMNAAHAAAEAVRNSAGYTGGGDGSKVSSIKDQISSGIGNVADKITNSIKGSGGSSSGGGISGNINWGNTGSSGSTQTGTGTKNQQAGGVATDNKSTNGTYTVGTDAGIKQAQSMKPGDTFTAKDGSVWTKNEDGKITVSHNGQNLDLVIAGSGSGTQSSGSGGKYTIGSSAGINQALSMKPGDTFTATDGSVWTKNEDGTITVSHNGQTLVGVVGGGGGPVIATDSNNNQISIIKDANGNIAAILNQDGSTSDSRGLVTVNENGSPNQYVITEDLSTGALKMIAASNSSVTLVKREEDGSLPETTLTGMNGMTLSGSNLIYGEDGRTYDKRTGKWIRDIAQEYGMDYSNVAIKVGDRYFSLDGEDITEQLGAGAITEWTGDKIYDALINAMMDQGFNQMPQFSDYEKLSWEQALAQAQEQLNSSYQKALNETLDDINQQALETGFYGQLPVEALKQQATSATELDKQTAIYDLARNLLSDSQDYAQQQYENDMNTSNSRMSTIQQIFTVIYQNNLDKLQQANNQQELDNEMNALILDAIATYATLTSQGLNNSQILEWLNKNMK